MNDPINQVAKYTSSTRIRRVLGLSHLATKKLCEGVDSFRLTPKVLQVSLAGLEEKIGAVAVGAIRQDIDRQRMRMPREWATTKDAGVPHPHQPDSK